MSQYFIQIDVEGSKITAIRVTDGRTVVRDASQCRLMNNLINSADDVGIEKPKVQGSIFKEVLFKPYKTIPDRKQMNRSDRCIPLTGNEGFSSELKNDFITESVQVNVSGPEMAVQERNINTKPRRHTKMPKKYEDYLDYDRNKHPILALHGHY